MYIVFIINFHWNGLDTLIGSANISGKVKRFSSKIFCKNILASPITNNKIYYYKHYNLYLLFFCLFGTTMLFYKFYVRLRIIKSIKCNLITLFIVLFYYHYFINYELMAFSKAVLTPSSGLLPVSKRPYSWRTTKNRDALKQVVNLMTGDVSATETSLLRSNRDDEGTVCV